MANKSLDWYLQKILVKKIKLNILRENRLKAVCSDQKQGQGGLFLT